MDIKLIAADLDGTLFNDSKEITPRTAEALRKASDMAIEIVPSTGRPFFAIPDNVKSLDFVNYYITCNGAAIYDKNGECLYEKTIGTALSEELVRRLNDPVISLDAFIEGKSYRYKSNMEIIDKLSFSDLMKKYIMETRNTVDDLAAFIAENSICVQKITLNFISDGHGGFIGREDTKKLLAEYSDRVDVVCGGGFDLEVTASGVSKGSGLETISKIVGADISQTMMIGDSENDLEAVRCAGIGAAMGNSEQCILDAADVVTLSNNEDGIAELLDRLLF